MPSNPLFGESMNTQYDDAILIDGLVIARFSRAVFEDMRKGGISAANCTCCIWHDFRATMANVAQWKHWFAERETSQEQPMVTMLDE